MAQVLKQLGQLRPSDTNAASLYSPPASTETIVKSIIVCNSSNDVASFRIFHDDDGTTYDEDTALYFDVELQSKQSVTLENNIMLNNDAGNLAIRSSVANAINFTAYGSEIS